MLKSTSYLLQAKKYQMHAVKCTVNDVIRMSFKERYSNVLDPGSSSRNPEKQVLCNYIKQH